MLDLNIVVCKQFVVKKWLLHFSFQNMPSTFLFKTYLHISVSKVLYVYLQSRGHCFAMCANSEGFQWCSYGVVTQSWSSSVSLELWCNISSFIFCIKQRFILINLFHFSVLQFWKRSKSSSQCLEQQSCAAFDCKKRFVWSWTSYCCSKDHGIQKPHMTGFWRATATWRLDTLRILS